MIYKQGIKGTFIKLMEERGWNKASIDETVQSLNEALFLAQIPIKLKERRRAFTQSAMHKDAVGAMRNIFVTAGFTNDGKVMEAFCGNVMKGSDLEALMTDGCILLSLLLQSGYELEDIIKKLGENRGEGETVGLPSSYLGTIAKTVMEIKQDLDKEMNVGD